MKCPICGNSIYCERLGGNLYLAKCASASYCDWSEEFEYVAPVNQVRQRPRLTTGRRSARVPTLR
jgi:hypothetical protein